jgi:hypothetical protein
MLDILYEHVESTFHVDKPFKLGYFESLILRDQDEDDREHMARFYPNTYWGYDKDLFERFSCCDHRESLGILREKLLKTLQDDNIRSSIPKVSLSFSYINHLDLI